MAVILGSSVAERHEGRAREASSINSISSGLKSYVVRVAVSLVPQ